MTVRDDASTIERSLESVRPLIDHWIIVDTGSSDGTRDTVQRRLANLPGALYDRPDGLRRGCADALELARECGDYVLLIDPGDVLQIEPDTALPPLTADAYTIDVHDRGYLQRLPRLVRSALAWRREGGVLCDDLECDQAGAPGLLSAISIHRDSDEALQKENCDREVALLEAELQAETRAPLLAHYRFRLAQCLGDSGDWNEALNLYLLRAKQGFSEEEVYLSLYRAGQIMERAGEPDATVLESYLRAAAVLPTRAEALHAASLFCRIRNRFEEGYALAKRGLGVPLPPEGRFIEPWIYAYGLRDEFSVSAYWADHFRESLDACEQLLSQRDLPGETRERVVRNAEFARQRVQELELPPRVEPAVTPATRWTPTAAAGGTELMVGRLQRIMGEELEQIDLRVNHPGRISFDERPKVVWIHHDADQQFVQWCADRELVNSVRCFVFVSYWQRERYLREFKLPAERCVVIRNAIEVNPEPRLWQTDGTWRCAYASTPFRGLSVLLDSWELLKPESAELHIWSSMKLYAEDDRRYEHLYERALSMHGVIYHGIAPNPELRAALRTMHFLTYPSTFAETACLVVMEAMAEGCRVIVPSLGALPETTSGYARIYPWNPNRDEHAVVFADVLRAEMSEPWDGNPEMSELQQAHCAAVFGLTRCVREWRELIRDLRSLSKRR